MMGRRSGDKVNSSTRSISTRWCRPIIWSGRSTAFSILIGSQGACGVLFAHGRPSIDPVLMIRMLIVGYVFAIRSERRLCSEVQVNLAYRWFCKLGIEDGIPDHSVFSRARHERFRQSDALRRVFEGVVAKCIAAGLVAARVFDRCEPDQGGRGQEEGVPGDQPIVGRGRGCIDRGSRVPGGPRRRRR